jgi:hypothetical protein
LNAGKQRRVIDDTIVIQLPLVLLDIGYFFVVGLARIYAAANREIDYRHKQQHNKNR